MRKGVALQGAERLIRRFGERRLVMVLLLLGFLIRFAATLWYKGVAPFHAENQMIAAALADHRGYADAFRTGSGPTAHTGPLAPLPVAAVYLLFGIETPAAEIVLALLGAASVTLSFYLAFRCFVLADGARTGPLLGLGFLCLVPMQTSLESREASVWEFGIVACLLFGLLLVVLRADRTARVSPLLLVGLAFATAFIEFLSPSAGLASAGALGLLLIRRTRWPMWFAIGGLTLAFYLAMTTPWMMRNERVLGAPVRSRSSFGLSFAIGYHEGQITDPDPRHANVERLKAIHPHYEDGPGYALMRQAGGEVAYDRKLIAETRAWIATHRGAAAYIAVRNLATFFFPPSWLWDRWTTEKIRARSMVRTGLAWTIAAAGLSTFAGLFWRRRWRYAYLAITMTLIVAPYIVSFPLLRYRFPVTVILTYAAFVGADGLLSRRRAPRTDEGRLHG